MKAIQNSIIYLISEIVNKAIPFILLPIITFYLSTEEYGVFSLYQTFIALLTPFITMNMVSQITINFFKLKKEEIEALISTIILILLFNMFIYFIVGIAVYYYFFSKIFSIYYYFLIFLIIFFQNINLIYFTILRNEKKAIKFGIFQILISILNFSITFILIKYFDLKWQSLIYGVLFSQLVISTYVILNLYFKFNLFKRYMSFFEIYKISFPLVFYLLGGSLIFLSDRIFIEYFQGLSKVGIYSIGNQFGLITTIIISAILMGINPYIYEILSNKRKININIINYSLMFVFVFIGLIVWKMSLIIFPIFVKNKEFYEGINLIRWFALSFVLRGFYQLNYNVIVFFKKNLVLMYISMGGALLNIILNYYLIPMEGIVGAAKATFISFLFMFIASFYISRKLLQKEFF